MGAYQNLILVIPEKSDTERDAVVAAWERGGGRLLKLDRFWEPPDLDPHDVRLYGNDSFCLVLEQQLHLHLISPADDFLAGVDRTWLKRDLQFVALQDAVRFTYPCFVKPVTPKQFRAMVYASHNVLLDECRGLEDTTPIMMSEVVPFTAEARTFVLDGHVMTCAVYEGTADHEAATRFATLFVDHHKGKLPQTCVLDFGCVASGEWSVLEANATWGAGLNGCDAEAAITCIASATTVANS
jgi:hypothetical protein